MNGRTALVTGITGQDGAYLAALLLEKGYAVHGVKRRTSSPNTARLERLFGPEDTWPAGLRLHEGDLTDGNGLSRLVQDVRPDEVYNLAAQSHVHSSFASPEYTANTDALGALRLLEAVRLLDASRRTRFYQASTSELFGQARETPQRETTPFHPRSPYAVAKLYAYWITVNFREAFGLHASNGILFNHESPLRGEAFVTRKITRAVAAIACGRKEPLRIGNLEARRDWGHARDYVEGMWLMLQQERPDDYVLASGDAHSVREFVELAFAETGRRIAWRKRGAEEQGIDAADGTLLVEVDPLMFRPAEVDILQGDASKSRARLGWRPKTNFTELVREMVAADLAIARTGE